MTRHVRVRPFGSLSIRKVISQTRETRYEIYFRTLLSSWNMARINARDVEQSETIENTESDVKEAL